jgi:hypothetical protein
MPDLAGIVTPGSDVVAEPCAHVRNQKASARNGAEASRWRSAQSSKGEVLSSFLSEPFGSVPWLIRRFEWLTLLIRPEGASARHGFPREGFGGRQSSVRRCTRQASIYVELDHGAPPPLLTNGPEPACGL